MTFKFVAKNLQTGRTGSVSVKADRETVARQKLTLSGYEIVNLVRVTNGQENKINIVYSNVPSTRLPRAIQAPSRSLVLKVKLGAFLQDILAPFALFA